MDEFIGTIKLFAFGFIPRDWAVCNGATLNPREYQALYSLIGNTYGGDGINAFAVPDLQGKEPVKGMRYCICLNGIYPPRD